MPPTLMTAQPTVFVLQCEDCGRLRSTMCASTCPWLHVTTNVAPRARSSIDPSPDSSRTSPEPQASISRQGFKPPRVEAYNG